VKIAVIGTGSVGGALGRRWSEVGHEVEFGSRDPQSEKVQQLLGESNGNLRATDIRSAMESAEVIVLAVPWPEVGKTLGAVEDLNDKVIIDCTNPINAQFDGLDLGFSESAGEKIAELAPGARVVKAFNTISSATMADPHYADHAATVFYCGDDDAAKEIVHQLCEELGLDAVDAGPLKTSRYLEPLAWLYIQLAIKHGWGSNCAFKILQREKPTSQDS